MATTKEYTVLVIGKSGSGKSTICNAITRSSAFSVNRGMDKQFYSASAKTVHVAQENARLRVIDTPDLFSQSHDRSTVSRELASINKLVTGDRVSYFSTIYPDIVLLALRSDQRFTKDDYQFYSSMKGPHVTADNLVLAFTHWQSGNVQELVKRAGSYMEQVYKDSKERAITFGHENTGCNSEAEDLQEIIFSHIRRNEESISGNGNSLANIALAGAAILTFIALRR